MADQSNEMGMVAKVARAIDPHAFAVFDSFREYCVRHGHTEEEALANAKWAHELYMEKAMAQARAAIEAMREPTEQMVSDMQDTIRFISDEWFPADGVKTVWSDAIEAALSHDEVKG